MTMNNIETIIPPKFHSLNEQFKACKCFCHCDEDYEDCECPYIECDCPYTTLAEQLIMISGVNEELLGKA